MAPRRSNHEGSIYQRKSDGLWMGVAHVGYDPQGKPLRKYVSAKTRTEVVRKLKDLRRRIDDGLLLRDDDVKLAELFERWFNDVIWRQNRRLERILKAAKLRSGAVVEDLDFSSTRGLDKATLHSLVNSPWVSNHHQVMIVGPTGVGKTFLACAIANHAIRDGATALYVRVPRLLDDLSVARADGRLARMMANLARVDVLILDDLLLRPHTDDQAADLLEVVEDRRGRSVIATSQLPISHWHEGLGDPTIADAILDRLLERSHRIELAGNSRRRNDATPRAKKQVTPAAK